MVRVVKNPNPPHHHKAGPLIEKGKTKLSEVLASKGVGVQQQVVAEEEDNL